MICGKLIKKIKKFNKKNVFRRQDKMRLHEHFHYICAFKAKEINKLNNELISKNTFPIFIKDKRKNSLIEIDNKDDYFRFLNLKKIEKKGLGYI